MKYSSRFRLASLVSTAVSTALLALASCLTFAAPAQADLIKAGSAYNRTVLLTDSADHVTGKTGLTLAVTVSKAGGAFASITPTVTERGGGKYTIALSTSDTATLGALDLQISATGADPCDTHDQVVAFDPGDGAGLGLSRLDTSVGSRQASGSPVVLPTLPNVTVGGFAAGVVVPDSTGTGTLLSRLPQTVLFTSGGYVKAFSLLDLTQTLDVTQTANDTVGTALNGASSQIAKAVVTGTPGTAGSTIKFYSPSGVLLKTFSLATSGSRQ